jgi:hypothetical protein
MISTRLTLLTATPHLNPLSSSQGGEATEYVTVELTTTDHYPLTKWSEISMADPLLAVHSFLRARRSFQTERKTGRLPIMDEMRRLIRLIEQ